MAGRPLRVLLFSSLFPHNGEPTLGIFVANRMRELIKHANVEVTVVAPVPWFPFKHKAFGAYGRAAQAKQVEKIDGVTVYHPRYIVIPKIGMHWAPNLMYFSAVRAIRKLIAQGVEFDLIDAHYLYPDGVAAAKLSKALSIPFVMTARGSDVTEIGLMERPRQKIQGALRSAAHTITVSNNLRADLMAMGGKAEKITTLRNGVDLDRFQETKRQETRSGWLSGPVLLFAGWLIPRKRLDLVLAVTAMVEGLVTVIVGDGPLRAELEAKAEELGISGRTLFLGQKSPAEMPEMFSAADVLLLPSDREGWANVLLEAMACGTPVVTRAIGGAPDLITSPEAGRVVDSDCAEDLAAAVRDVLDNPPARAETRAFAENYDWRETSAGQMTIFTKSANLAGEVNE